MLFEFIVILQFNKLKSFFFSDSVFKSFICIKINLSSYNKNLYVLNLCPDFFSTISLYKIKEFLFKSFSFDIVFDFILSIKKLFL